MDVWNYILGYRNTLKSVFETWVVHIPFKNDTAIRSSKMAQAISENCDRVLWKEVKCLKKSSNVLAKVIDGCDNVKDIADKFAMQFNQLYNSVGYDAATMSLLNNRINSLIDDTHMPDGIIDRSVLRDCINNMKCGKREESGLFSDHIVHGTNKLFDVLTALYNEMIIHGVSPQALLLGTMVPLQKENRKSNRCSDNYRALTLGSIISKLYDAIIIQQHSNVFITSDLQFGFKNGLSTTMCTFMVQETITYYVNNGSTVHILLLDASKAFDRVNYCLLFNKLLDKGMCPLTVRLLLQMYLNQTLHVKWDDIISRQFNVTNGVRQGGVLSPLLFSVYIDDLMNALESHGMGCCIGQKLCGAAGYADDIILLGPTSSGLRQMIDICEKYADLHDIIFNGIKSKVLVYNKKVTDPHFKVNGNDVPNCETAVYLGTVLSTRNNFETVQDCKKKVQFLL